MSPTVKAKTGQTGVAMSEFERQTYKSWLEGQGGSRDYRPSTECQKIILQAQPQKVLQIPTDLIGQQRKEKAVQGFDPGFDPFAVARRRLSAGTILHQENVVAATA
jgi:hypothetical protein